MPNGYYCVGNEVCARVITHTQQLETLTTLLEAAYRWNAEYADIDADMYSGGTVLNWHISSALIDISKV